ncbi:MAG TPA: hypothetical protein VGX68_28780 [Thermoanaerobaculia bacterium]|nr:hypothetical protein [Thermoanaerobaculia bacterium]
MPAPTKDLSVVQQGPRLLLSFAYPQVTPAGTALEGISAVEIWTASRPAVEGKANPMDSREFNAAAKLAQKLAGADLTAATEGDRVNVLLPLPETSAGAAPQAQYFAIRTFGKEGDRSDLSNVASLVPKAPPAAPARVNVTARADGVLVEWSGVEGATAGYNVYRRSSQERAHGRPIHVAGQAERSWLDTTARFGESYIYTVTALAQQEPVVESAITSEHEVRYQDRFAPPAPTELVALAETGRVRLVWRASEADDLAGYLVYRRVGESGAFERLTAQPVDVAEFNDTAVRGGESYSYRVTAVDQTGNESAPGGEVRAVVP